MEKVVEEKKNDLFEADMDILAGKFKHLVHHHPKNELYSTSRFIVAKSYFFIDITKSKETRELINRLISISVF